MIEKKCLYCGELFTSYRRQNQRYCSCKCAAFSRDRGIHSSSLKKCLECGKEYKTFPSINKKFCSPKCCAIYYGRQRRQENNGYYKTNERVSSNGDRVLLNRYLMESKLERKLKTTEIVHHVDLDRGNNPTDCSNYYIYNGKREHNLGHSSLIPVVSQLIKDGIIQFNDGIYIGEVKTTKK